MVWIGWPGRQVQGYHPTVFGVVVVMSLLLTIFGLGPQAVAKKSTDKPRYQDARGNIIFAFTGDSVITRRLSVHDEPAFRDLRTLIREAGASFTNLEVLFHDWGDGVIPQAGIRGTYMRGHSHGAQELAWMGFDLVSRANNHAMDYGVGGMRETTAAVEAAGLVHAGVGENLALARAPRYLETQNGRVALIAVTSTFPPHGIAGAQRKDIRGRPGVSPFRFEQRFVVPEEDLRNLEKIATGFGWTRHEGEQSVEMAHFLGGSFVSGDSYGMETSPYEKDLQAIVREVEHATRQAEWVVVSCHTHEGRNTLEHPPAFFEDFARKVIDAGADIVVGHGPHLLRGIEIYKNRPIFYSLGNFIFQNETVTFQPADSYELYDLPSSAVPSDFYDQRNQVSGGGLPANPAFWESVVAVPRFVDGELAEVHLYPITLGYGLSRSQRGRPMLASGDYAQEILSNLQHLSEPYGTHIQIEDTLGVIKVRRDP